MSSSRLDPRLLRGVADHFGFQGTDIVEKDYEVAKLLHVVSQIQVPGFQLVFGGGTALARAHRLIERMSEDVDLKLVRAPAAGELTKSQVKKRRSQLKRDLIAQLRAAGFPVSLEKHVTADHENSHILITVPYSRDNAGTEDDVLRPHIQLELMASELRCPPVTCPISSFVAQAKGDAPEVAAMPCIDVTETSAEKIISLTRRIAVDLESNGTRAFDKTIIRHVYDLHAIAAAIDVGLAIRLYRDLVAGDIEQYGNQHPVYNADPERATFRALAELEASWRHRSSYAAFMTKMVYGQHVPFHTALETVKSLVESAWRSEPRRVTPSPNLYGDIVAGTAGRLVADFAEGDGFRASLEQSAGLAIDLTPEAEAAMPEVAKHLPPVGMLTVAQHSGRSQISTPQAAAQVLVSDALGVAAERLANAMWLPPAKELDHLQSDDLTVERTTAFAGHTVYRARLADQVLLVTDDVAALFAMTPEQLRALSEPDAVGAGDDPTSPSP